MIVREYELREELEETWAALMFAGFSAIELVRADKLRALAVATATRSEALPNLPTVGEFVPGYEVSGWYGMVAPKNTRGEMVSTLNTDINSGLLDPTIKARFADIGATALAGSPGDFGKLIAYQTEKWAKVVNLSDIVGDCAVIYADKGRPRTGRPRNPPACR